MPWDEVVKDFAEPVAASRLHPDPSRHAVYRGLMDVYAACEAHALGRGPLPAFSFPLPELTRRDGGLHRPPR